MLLDGMQTAHGNALVLSAPPLAPERTCISRGHQRSITSIALKASAKSCSSITSFCQHRFRLPSTALQAHVPPPKASARHHVNPEPSSLSSVQELLAAIESDMDKGGAL